MSFRPAISAQHHRTMLPSLLTVGAGKAGELLSSHCHTGRMGPVELSSDMEDRGIFEHLRRVEGTVLWECVFRLRVWHVVKMNLSIHHLE